MTQTDSLYEQLFPLTTIMKQRVVDNFSGDSVNERWTTRDNTNSSLAMDDSIDGGVKLTTGASNDNRISLDFNDIRQYDYNDSVVITTMKIDDTSNRSTIVGFANAILTSVTDTAYAMFDTAFDSTYFVLQNSNSSITTTATSVTADTNYHSYKLELGASDIKLYVDGVSESTSTTNLPNTALQPHIGNQSRTGVKVQNVNYYEAYNT